jgi:hypothetical protein
VGNAGPRKISRSSSAERRLVGRASERPELGRRRDGERRGIERKAERPGRGHQQRTLRSRVERDQLQTTREGRLIPGARTEHRGEPDRIQADHDAFLGRARVGAEDRPFDSAPGVGRRPTPLHQHRVARARDRNHRDQTRNRRCETVAFPGRQRLRGCDDQLASNTRIEDHRRYHPLEQRGRQRALPDATEVVARQGAAKQPDLVDAIGGPLRPSHVKAQHRRRRVHRGVRLDRDGCRSVAHVALAALGRLGQRAGAAGERERDAHRESTLENHACAPPSTAGSRQLRATVAA